jgi:hypothetical protein
LRGQPKARCLQVSPYWDSRRNSMPQVTHFVVGPRASAFHGLTSLGLRSGGRQVAHDLTRSGSDRAI